LEYISISNLGHIFPEQSSQSGLPGFAIKLCENKGI
jgi:hypothetical protein